MLNKPTFHMQAKTWGNRAKYPMLEWGFPLPAK
jgi:hypothetical protein